MSLHDRILRVSDVMTGAPTTVKPDLSAWKLKGLFDRTGFNAFPVVNPEGELLGIVTNLDILRLLRPEGAESTLTVYAPGGETIRDLMHPGVVTVEPEDPAFAAVDLLLHTRFRSLPVVERKGGGRILVGMVSRTDLIRELWREAGEG